MTAERSRLVTFGLVVGIAAVILAVEHGVGELQQANYTPNSVFINAQGGPTCNVNAGQVCLPAFTLLALVPVNIQTVGIIVLVWSVIVLATAVLSWRSWSRWYLLEVSSVVLLLVGGGYIPPILGIVGGVLTYYGRKRQIGTPASPPAP